MRFIVSLQYEITHFCTGSLIAVNNVLTAASCIYLIKKNELPPYWRYSAKVGITTLYSPAYRHKYKFLHIHSDYIYGSDGVFNDIAVITVSDNILK